MRNGLGTAFWLGSAVLLGGCTLFSGKSGGLSSVEHAQFLKSEKRPDQELYDIAWSLCAAEIKQVDKSRSYERDRPQGANWAELGEEDPTVYSSGATCDDLHLVASLVVQMVAPDANVQNGFHFGDEQLTELRHELLATTPSGAPAPAHQHAHLRTFSPPDKPIARQMVVDFFHAVMKARALINSDESLVKYLRSVPDNWLQQPFYYAYVQYFGVEDRQLRLSPASLRRIASGEKMGREEFLGSGTFNSLEFALTHLKKLGIRNLYILPHYESENGDGGYDVSQYEPADRLGGPSAFRKLMATIRREGFRLASDAIFNHTSYKHDWFQAFMKQEEGFQNHYLDVTHWVEGRFDDTTSQGKRIYQTGNRTTERIAIFPEVSKTHFFRYKVGEEERKAYHHFYPFQVDLNLLEPAVLRSIWDITARELAQGQMAKRADASIHWIKPDGTEGDAERAALAATQLFRHFIKMVNSKAAVLPESVNWVGAAHQLFGTGFSVGRQQEDFAESRGTTGVFSFEAQSMALREMLVTWDVTPWWSYWNKALNFNPPPGSTWLNLLSHHDEMFLGMVSEKERDGLVKHIESRGGIPYKRNFSAAIRLASLLSREPGRRAKPDPTRLAMAHVALFSLPGTPVVYYGDEVLKTNDDYHFESASQFQTAYFLRMEKDPLVEFRVGSELLSRDPRLGQDSKNGTPPEDLLPKLNPAKSEWLVRDPRELLRGAVTTSQLLSVDAEPLELEDNLFQQLKKGSEQSLVVRVVHEMTRLRGENRGSNPWTGSRMFSMNSGTKSVLALCRGDCESQGKWPSVGVVANLSSERQDIWLNEDELKGRLGIERPLADTQVLLRLVQLQGESLPPNYVASGAEIDALVREGVVSDAAASLKGASHEGHLRISMAPHEFIVFRKK